MSDKARRLLVYVSIVVCSAGGRALAQEERALPKVRVVATEIEVS